MLETTKEVWCRVNRLKMSRNLCILETSSEVTNRLKKVTGAFHRRKVWTVRGVRTKEPGATIHKGS